MSLQPRTVQRYIDETPSWRDGTPTTFVPLTSMQWRIWLLASAGKFFEGKVVFLTGVALPLIVKEFGLSLAEKGIVSAAPLAGIMVGALALGSMADVYGRRRMFVVELVAFTLFLIGLALSPGLPWLVAFLFGIGVALGCDYPTGHIMISETISSRDRGKLVLCAFAFQAVGALVGTVVGYLILANMPEVGAWRWMYATAIIPAILVVIGRCTICESGHWLMTKGRRVEAESEVARLLAREPPYPKQVTLADHPMPADAARGEGGWRALFVLPGRRATILASVPWFLQDLGTYGIGIFTPTILARTVGHEYDFARNVSAMVERDMLAAKGAAVIDVLLIVGILAAVLLADRVGRIRLQIVGFIGCAAGLAVATLSQQSAEPWRTLMLFAGFMLFNLMTNLGPNAQTYLLAGEVFPTDLRGKGAGLAAAIAKVGAVLTAFLFPVLLAEVGINVLLSGLIVTSLLGAWVTWQFRIETAGVNLEEIGRQLGSATSSHGTDVARRRLSPR
jgi:MFS family permease